MRPLAPESGINLREKQVSNRKARRGKQRATHGDRYRHSGVDPEGTAMI